MKAYLKPEDDQECLRMVKSLDLVRSLWDMDQWLRAQIKYDQKEYLQEARNELHDILYEHDINLEELYS